MRPVKYNKSKKPQAFISNLYKLLQDQSNSEYIKWREDEQSFIIVNISKFGEHILPRYYKHSNYSSFVRQLNMYNFYKVRTQMEGQHVFRNEQFVKNSWQNLKLIKRREVTNNNKSQKGILALAQAISSAGRTGVTVDDNNNNQLSIGQQSHGFISNDFNFQSNSQNQLMEFAAPQKDKNTFQSPFILDSYHFPGLQKLKLDPIAQQFLYQSQKVPSVLPLKPQRKYFPLKTRVQELKSNQLQLQQVCVSLYKQNQFLTGQNKRLQERLKNQFKKKQQILNQIIKYVINFLSEWNTGSSDLDDDIDIGKDHLSKDHVISDEQSSSSQIIMESYDFLQKKRSFVNGVKQNKEQNDQKGLKFSKYAKNQKKILLTLLKEIEKSYNQKFFFTQGHSSTNHHQTNSHSQFPHFQSNQYPSTSPNNFMMSMLLKFIQSNNLVEVIKRFSLLLNLQRNKKSKNFTVVDCMKDLRQRFQLKEFQKSQSKRKNMKEYEYQNTKYLVQPQGFEHLHAKQMFLQNQKQTIKQMEKQLALITNPKSKSNQIRFLENDAFGSQDHQSSFLSFITQKVQEQNRQEFDNLKTFRKNNRVGKKNINKQFF